MGLNIFENEETSEKEFVEIEDWGFSVHFVLGFQENSIYTLHLCFSYDITKWCKVYTKADFWFQKSHEKFEQLQTSSVKSKKLKFDGLLPKKCIPSAKIIFRGIYPTFFSTTCVKTHQITYVIFETIRHFSRHNFSVRF